jgi:hypothetical protein
MVVMFVFLFSEKFEKILIRIDSCNIITLFQLEIVFLFYIHIEF